MCTTLLVIGIEISTFICQHDYLNERKSGFRKLFSTATAVVDVSDFILTELDNKKICLLCAH